VGRSRLKYNELRNISGSKNVAELSKKKILSLQGESPALAEGLGDPPRRNATREADGQTFAYAEH